jgi:hypothetical protein
VSLRSALVRRPVEIVSAVCQRVVEDAQTAQRLAEHLRHLRPAEPSSRPFWQPPRPDELLDALVAVPVVLTGGQVRLVHQDAHLPPEEALRLCPSGARLASASVPPEAGDADDVAVDAAPVHEEACLEDDR